MAMPSCSFPAKVPAVTCAMGAFESGGLALGNKNGRDSKTEIERIEDYA
jgi:hypothetical protein